MLPSAYFLIDPSTAHVLSKYDGGSSLAQSPALALLSCADSIIQTAFSTTKSHISLKNHYFYYNFSKPLTKIRNILSQIVSIIYQMMLLIQHKHVMYVKQINIQQLIKNINV